MEILVSMNDEESARNETPRVVVFLVRAARFGGWLVPLKF